MTPEHRRFLECTCRRFFHAALTACALALLVTGTATAGGSTGAGDRIHPRDSKPGNNDERQPFTGRIVQTTYGPIMGKDSLGTSIFLGIPFAAPPTGDLRWKRPQPPAGWTDYRLALDYPPACPQLHFDQGDTTGEYVGTEDCLYLNVWSPTLNDSLLPVMVFIHGGGNQQGYTAKERAGAIITDGYRLASHQNAVVVTIQYRLGPLGYLVHPGLGAEYPDGLSGNYGLLDQILALQWVQDNIARFGGDKTRVLAFGESAGAVNVSLLLSSPLAQSLFSRALIQSGAPVARTWDTREAEGLLFANTMACGGATPEEEIACLRSLEPDSLVSLLTSPLASGLVSMAWGPVIDGWVLPDDPLVRYQNGLHNQMPVVIGSNQDEMSASVPPVVSSAEVAVVIALLVPLPLWDEATAFYPLGNNDAVSRESLIGITTDGQFTSTTRLAARALVDGQFAPVYRYWFTRYPDNFLGQLYGAYHGLELYYVFGTLEGSSLIGVGGLDVDDSTMIEQMGRYWRRFADTGDPNGGSDPVWPAYGSGSDLYLELSAAPLAGNGIRTDQCDFWDEVRDSQTLILSEDDLKSNLPDGYTLGQNYANPFNPTTRIEFGIPEQREVRLVVFDMLGRRVRTLVDQSLPAGNHSVEWDGTDNNGANVASGIYFYRLSAGEFTDTKKMTLLK